MFLRHQGSSPNHPERTQAREAGVTGVAGIRRRGPGPPSNRDIAVVISSFEGSPPVDGHGGGSGSPLVAVDARRNTPRPPCGRPYYFVEPPMTSILLTMSSWAITPTKLPLSMTGRRLTLWSCIVFSADSSASSAPMVTGLP